MARMLPHLALVPLLIIWVGIGESMKITLVALGVFFPLYFNVYAGIRDIDERLVEAARTCGLGPWARLRHVILPGALPSLFLGLRLAIGAACLTAAAGILTAPTPRHPRRPKPPRHSRSGTTDQTPSGAVRSATAWLRA